jgi:predicted GIY-YIG superfamily endonuclease
MGTRSFYVYILASRIGGTLYIGVTNDLVRRVAEHRLKLAKGFTKKYDVDRLIYFEQFDDADRGTQSQLGRSVRKHRQRLSNFRSTPRAVMPREGGVSSNTRE